MIGKIILTILGAILGTVAVAYTVGYGITFIFCAAACSCAGIEVSSTAGEIFRWVISALIGVYGSVRIFWH